MEKEVFCEILLKKARQMNIELTENQLNQFYKYMELLLEWNEKINLTAIVEPEEVIQKHFIDSLTILKYIKTDETLIDIGTGAGFPGIPLKIARENIKITLLDSLNKRVKFLNEVIEKLDLKNIVAVHGRIEEFGKNKKYREKYDIATSRAVANLSTLSEYLIPMIKIDGKCICMKGSEVEKEIQESQRAIKILGGKIVENEQFNLPESDIKRNIIIIKKEKSTPLQFPRKPGTPAKEPIK